MKRWGASGAFWGGIRGLLLGSAFFVPGIGPVLVAVPLAAWIVGALEGAVVVGGLSAVDAGMYSIGVPRDVDHESGLLGFSETSSDMRDLIQGKPAISAPPKP